MPRNPLPPSPSHKTAAYAGHGVLTRLFPLQSATFDAVMRTYTDGLTNVQRAIVARTAQQLAQRIVADRCGAARAQAAAGCRAPPPPSAARAAAVAAVAAASFVLSDTAAASPPYPPSPATSFLVFLPHPAPWPQLAHTYLNSPPPPARSLTDGLSSWADWYYPPDGTEGPGQYQFTSPTQTFALLPQLARTRPLVIPGPERVSHAALPAGRRSLLCQRPASAARCPPLPALPAAGFCCTLPAASCSASGRLLLHAARRLLLCQRPASAARCPPPPALPAAGFCCTLPAASCSASGRLLLHAARRFLLCQRPASAARCPPLPALPAAGFCCTLPAASCSASGQLLLHAACLTGAPCTPTDRKRSLCPPAV
jgi:hypothetical protein